jgi:hypothetical protein
MLKIVILSALLIISGHLLLQAQDKTGGRKSSGTEVGRDTAFTGFLFPPHDSILHFNLGPIEMVAPYHFKNSREEKKYSRLETDILKTYPLAMIVGSELKIVNTEFENRYTTPSKRKNYIKWYQKYVYTTYIDTLKNLNEEQGRILLKLIHRETGKTPYELIKSYRGGLNALLWRSMAFMAGANLNSRYNPEENEMIEHIIRRYGSGEFN